MTGKRRPAGSAPAEPTPSRAAISADDVVAYLAAHPEFIAAHDELLASLIPDTARGGGNVVDLQHFVVHRLRQRVSELEAAQRLLLTSNRTASARQTRIHAAVLALLAARSFEQLIQIATNDLAVLLDLDVATLCIESALDSGRMLSGIRLVPPGTVAALLGDGESGARLDDRHDEESALFGAAAGLVRSRALLRLSIGVSAPPMMIALGSRRATRFRAGQGMEGLNFLARSLELAIGRWLSAAA